MTTTTLEVTGMTSQQCVGNVSTGLKELTGVKNVTVKLNAEGASVVSVFSDNAIDRAALEGAVGEAGDFQLVAVR